MSLASVTREQMREIDRIMIEDLGIQLVQMMENAGRHLARFVVDRHRPKTVRVLAGSGGNGGGGMVAARHLANWGVAVALSTTDAAPGPTPGHQRGILSRMGIEATPMAPADVFIDAIIGYSLDGAPRGSAAQLITSANAFGVPIVALDAPSGTDVDTGQAPGATIEAEATLTLAAPKVGLLGAASVGELWVADISVPPAVYVRVGLSMPPDVFADSSIVRV